MRGFLGGSLDFSGTVLMRCCGGDLATTSTALSKRAHASDSELEVSPLEILAMPRKPFKPFADRHRGGQIDIGIRTISQRPELMLLVAKCLTSWPHIESEMALLLGHLLGAQSGDAAMAVFNILRRSSAQRDAISEAGRVLDSVDRELLSAVLNVHKSVEAERNALAHGQMGTYSLMPDTLLWMTSADYIEFKALLVLKGDTTHSEEKRDKINSMLSYYEAKDLEQIAEDIDMMGWLWSELRTYLQTMRPATHAELYRQLCDRPHIAQELERLRREKTPLTPPG